MKKISNWVNTFPDYAKVWVVALLVLSLCFGGLFAGLAYDGVSPSKFVGHANAGTGGQIVFWFFAALWAVSLIITLTAKRAK